MSSRLKFKRIPMEDEITQYGVTIFWSSVRIVPATDNPRNNIRWVKVLCKCGREKEMKVHDVQRSKYHGLCFNCAAIYFVPRGPKHSDWTGGIFITQLGYRHINKNSLSPEELELFGCMVQPKRPYIPEHRLVMARHLGRPLLRSEVIHHINKIKDDNRIENLMLVDPHEHPEQELISAHTEIKRLRAILDKHHIEY